MRKIKMWKQFESINNNNYIIDKITANDLPEVIELVYNVFKDIVPETREDIEEEIMDKLDYDLFFKISDGDKIIGTYQLYEADFCAFICHMKSRNSKLFLDIENSEIEKWRDIQGIEGVQLSVLPEYRDKGAGKMLIDFVSKLGYPYIMGQHYESLGNIDHWAKRRKIVGHYLAGDTKIYLTIGEFEQVYEPEMELILQEDDYTCGNTVLQMLCEYYDVDKTIEDLINVCGTNSDIGTTGEMMKDGLDTLGFGYIHLTPSNIKNLNRVDYLVGKRKDFLILRGLVQEQKHWVLLASIKDGKYEIYDPWLGHYTLDRKGIIDIWQPRQYEGFVVYSKEKN